MEVIVLDKNLHLQDLRQAIYKGFTVDKNGKNFYYALLTLNQATEFAVAKFDDLGWHVHSLKFQTLSAALSLFQMLKGCESVDTELTALKPRTFPIKYPDDIKNIVKIIFSDYDYLRR